VVVVVSVADVAFGGSVPGGVTGAAVWPGRGVAGRRRSAGGAGARRLEMFCEVRGCELQKWRRIRRLRAGGWRRRCWSDSGRDATIYGGRPARGRRVERRPCSAPTACRPPSVCGSRTSYRPRYLLFCCSLVSDSR